MALRTVVQRLSPLPDAPANAAIRAWAESAFKASGHTSKDLVLTIRIVGESEAVQLNRDYLGKDYPPNVLSFPLQTADDSSDPFLGDVVICQPVVKREAAEQGKSVAAHLSHLVIHGVLHCCGMDHDSDAGAARMEALETRILAEFGFPDPYTGGDER